MVDIPEWRVRMVEKYSAQLTSDDPRKRRDAARWLGEALEDPAIPRLIELYQTDPDRRVRQAAKYALGQFKAFQNALDQDEAFAEEIIQDVVIHGKLGRPAPTAGLRTTLFALALSLVAILGLYLALPAGLLGDAIDSIDLSALSRIGAVGGETQTTALPTGAASGFIARPDPGDPRRVAILAELRRAFIRLRDDVNNMTRQLQRVLGGDPLDCAAYFNNIQPFPISPENAARYPDIANFVERMNTALDQYNTTFARYDAACFGTEPLSIEEVGPVFAAFRPAIDAVGQLDADLVALEGLNLPTPGGPTAPQGLATLPLPTPAPDEPTPTPTPDASRALAAAFNVIDSMTGTRGPAALLVTYWRDVERGGQTAGCNLPDPTIPEALRLDEALRANELLAQAVDLTNQALEATRAGWQAFRIACNSRTLTNEVGRQLPVAQAALQLFRTAGEILAQVR
jgi:hypothetical protein